MHDKTTHDPATWIRPLWLCFGPDGVAALAFWLGSLVAEDIRARHGSFPILQITGEPGSGKTTLIDFLWRLFGRPSYEGFAPERSTQSALNVKVCENENLPLVLLDIERLDEFKSHVFKPLYNGECPVLKTSHGCEPATVFRGALVLSQQEPHSSFAMLERCLCIHLTVDSHTAATRNAAHEIWEMDDEALSGFIATANSSKDRLLEVFDERFPHYMAALDDFGKPVNNLRKLKNHAQLAALVDALECVVPLGRDEKQTTLVLISEMFSAVGGNQ
jgi:hypothetical protein